MDQDPSPNGKNINVLGQVDWAQIIFWGSLLVAVAAAGATAAWPAAGGSMGLVLLIAMAAGGMVFLLWIIRGAGRRMGLFPERGAMAEAMKPVTPRFSWLESLDEAALICDEGGAPLAANDAYLTLTQTALAGQADALGPVSVDRIFSAFPGLAAPIFRLSKSAKAGERRRESLPAMTLYGRPARAVRGFRRTAERRACGMAPAPDYGQRGFYRRCRYARTLCRRCAHGLPVIGR